MDNNKIVQLKSYNDSTGELIGEIYPTTNVDAIMLDNGETLKEKLNNNDLAINNITNNQNIIQGEILSINNSIEEIKKETVWSTPEEYGAVGDGVTDDTEAFIGLFSNCTNILIPSKTYSIRCDFGDEQDSHLVDGNFLKDGLFEVNEGTIIKGQRGNMIKSLPTDKWAYNMLTIKNNNIEIDGVNFLGERHQHIITDDNVDSDGYAGEYGFGIAILSGKNIVIKNCKMNDFWGDGICTMSYPNSVDPIEDILIENCIMDNNRRQGLSICYGKKYTINNCTFSNTNGTLPESGVDIEPERGWTVSDVEFNNCIFKDNNCVGLNLIALHEVNSINNVRINNCISKNNGTGEIYLYNSKDVIVNGCTVTPIDYFCSGVNNCENVTFMGNNFDSTKIIEYSYDHNGPTKNTNILFRDADDFRTYIGEIPAFENWRSSDPDYLDIIEKEGGNLDVTMKSEYAGINCKISKLIANRYYKVTCDSFSPGLSLSFSDDMSYKNSFGFEISNSVIFKVPTSTACYSWLNSEAELPRTLKIVNFKLELLDSNYSPDGTEKTWNISSNKTAYIEPVDGVIEILDSKEYQKIWLEGDVSSVTVIAPSIDSENFKKLNVMLAPPIDLNISFSSNVYVSENRILTGGNMYELIFTHYRDNYWLCEIKEYIKSVAVIPPNTNLFINSAFNTGSSNNMCCSNEFSLYQGKTYTLDLGEYAITGKYAAFEFYNENEGVWNDFLEIYSTPKTFTVESDYARCQFYLYGQDGVDCFNNKDYLTWTLKEVTN